MAGIICRVLGPVLFTFIVFATFDFQQILLRESLSTKHDLIDLPFNGLNFITLMHFINAFDCTAWVLNPIDSEELRCLAKMICMDSPLVSLNSQFMHNLFTRFPNPYKQEAKRRVRLINEKVRSIT